jgi:hypothetical protein
MTSKDSASIGHDPDISIHLPHLQPLSTRSTKMLFSYHLSGLSSLRIHTEFIAKTVYAFLFYLFE